MDKRAGATEQTVGIWMRLNRPQCCAFASVPPALLLVEPVLLSRRQHPASPAYDTRQRCIVPVSETRSNGPERSSPNNWIELTGSFRGHGKGAYIHHVVIHDEGGSFGLGLISYPNLTNAAIPSEQLIQVLPRYLVVQVLHE